MWTASLRFGGYLAYRFNLLTLVALFDKFNVNTGYAEGKGFSLKPVTDVET
jgi:hypothetical protein